MHKVNENTPLQRSRVDNTSWKGVRFSGSTTSENILFHYPQLRSHDHCPLLQGLQ